MVVCIQDVDEDTFFLYAYSKNAKIHNARVEIKIKSIGHFRIDKL